LGIIHRELPEFIAHKGAKTSMSIQFVTQTGNLPCGGIHAAEEERSYQTMRYSLRLGGLV
jgi:hypothetical protein